MVSSGILLAIVYAAFVSLGLPDGAIGVAWPAMRAELGLPLEALGLVTILATAGSAASGFASGRVLARLGTPLVVAISGLMTGLSLLGFAFAPSYLVVVALALPLGFGAGSVDAGLNHYAAERWSSRHMNWLHASWGLGAALGPAAITWAIASGGGWRLGYLSIAGAQLSLALVFFATLRLWGEGPSRGRALKEASGAAAEATRAPGDQAEAGDSSPAGGPAAPGGRAIRAALMLAPLGYFIYAGLEVGLGAWAASVLKDGRGYPAELAGVIAASYYGSIGLGRVVSGLVADRVGNRRMVRLGFGLAAVGLLVFGLDLGPLASLVGIALAGLGYAPIYPCLMHETPRRFDRETTRRVVGRQVASAYLGGAILPPLVGLVAGRFGLWAVAPMVGLYLAAMAVSVAALDART